MSEKKTLYCVEVTYKAYVLAGSHAEAEGFANEIVRTEDFPEVESDTLRQWERIEGSGWSPHSLVYHSGTDDIALRDVWPKGGDHG